MTPKDSSAHWKLFSADNFFFNFPPIDQQKQVFRNDCNKPIWHQVQSFWGCSRQNKMNCYSKENTICKMDSERDWDKATAFEFVLWYNYWTRDINWSLLQCSPEVSTVSCTHKRKTQHLGIGQLTATNNWNKRSYRLELVIYIYISMVLIHRSVSKSKSLLQMVKLKSPCQW